VGEYSRDHGPGTLGNTISSIDAGSPRTRCSLELLKRDRDIQVAERELDAATGRASAVATRNFFFRKSPRRVDRQQGRVGGPPPRNQ